MKLKGLLDGRLPNTGGTNRRLAQLRKSPRAGTRRSPDNDDAKRRSRLVARQRSAIMLLLNQEAAEDKRVHAGTKEGAERVGGCVHDRLAT